MKAEINKESCDCGDSHCTHNHHAKPQSVAQATVENALKYSKKKMIVMDDPAALSEVEASVCAKLLAIADKLAVDGAVLGHIKAVITIEHGSCAISVTKTCKADVKYIGGWDKMRVVDGYSLTVNVLSIANAEFDVDDCL